MFHQTCKFLLALLFSSVFAMSIFAQNVTTPQSHLLALFPAGGKVGETVDVEITEAFEIDEATELIFNHSGITAKTKMSEADDFYPEPRRVRNQFLVTISANTPPGVYEVRAMIGSMMTNARRFVVGTVPETSEVEDNNTRETATEVPVGGAVNGRFGRDFDFFKFTAGQGQNLVIDCQSQRIDSRGDPVLILFDTNGREITRSHDAAGRDPMVFLKAAAAGDYYLRVNDLTFMAGGGQGTAPYRISIADKPWIDLVEPPIVQIGKATQVTLYGNNLGGQMSEVVLDGRQLEKLTVSITGQPNSQSNQDHLAVISAPEAMIDGFYYQFKKGNTLSNPIRIGLCKDQSTGEMEPNDKLEAPQQLTLPASVSGRFHRSGDIDGYVFEAKKDETLAINVQSQQIGQPTDVLMVVQQLTTQDDGSIRTKDLNVADDPVDRTANFRFQMLTTDPSYVFKAPEDGKYRIIIRDQFDVAGSGRPACYRLTVAPPRPRFRLVALGEYLVSTNNNRNLKPIAMHARRGGGTEVLVFAYRQDGFDGPIELRTEGLPSGVTSELGGISPTLSFGGVVIQAANNAAAWRGPVLVKGRAQIDGKNFEQTAIPLEILWANINNNQAPVRIAPALQLAVNDEMQMPARIETMSPSLRTARGGKVKLPVKLIKNGEWSGNVTADVVGLHSRITKKTANLTPDGKQAELELDVNVDVPPGIYRIHARGEVDIDYRRRVDLEDLAKEDQKRIVEVVKRLSDESTKATAARTATARDMQTAQQLVNTTNSQKTQAATVLQQAKQAADQATEKSQQAMTAFDQATKKKTDADNKVKSAADEAAKAQAATELKQVTQQLQTAQTNLDNAKKAAAAATKKFEEATAKLTEMETKLNQATEDMKKKTEANTLAMENETKARDAKTKGDTKKREIDTEVSRATSVARQKKVKVPVHSKTISFEVVAFPAEVKLKSHEFKVTAGESCEIVVDCKRDFEFKDEVTFSLQTPSGAGSWQLPNAKIEKEKNQAKLELAVSKTSKAGEYTTDLIVRMRFNNRQLEDRISIKVIVLPAPEEK
jgi:hypothetical protein